LRRENKQTTKGQNMKLNGWIFAAIAAATLALAGCAKKDSIDTASLEKSFKPAEATTQSSVDKVVTAIKSSDYSTAVAELKTLASNTKLTPEQQQAVKDIMAQVEKAIADAAGKAAGEASKAAGDAGKAAQDVPKTLPK
jgi:hypothetical protein